MKFNIFDKIVRFFKKEKVKDSSISDLFKECSDALDKIAFYKSNIKIILKHQKRVDEILAYLDTELFKLDVKNNPDKVKSLLNELIEIRELKSFNA